MYRVLITGAIHETGVQRLRAEPDIEVDFRPDLPLAEIMEVIGGYHGLITRSETPVPRELIDRAGQLKVIARAAVGYANIDVDYATERGILVLNTPGKNTNSAAELAFGLLLAAVRKMTQAHATMQAGGWDRHRFSGVELMGKTIGIVGLGNVGHRMARFAHGFEMKVLAYDPYIPDETFDRHHAEKTVLDDLLQRCDILSLHTPKNKETIGMIGAREIGLMKPGSVIINAARGGIVDDDALLDALKSGRIAAAGIDTWSREPMTDNPFSELPQVVMSPHIGASTEEAQMRVADSIAQQVPRALRGWIVDYPVNMPQIRMLEGDLMTSYTVLAEKLGLFAAQYMDFTPERLELTYRGSLTKQDCTLLRLAFLKGYLKPRLDFVSYVNAEQRAASIGISVTSVNEPGFTDYESELFATLTGGDQTFTIGGVVFSGPHPRISHVDGFDYEVDPEGTFLAIRSLDRLGVVQAIVSLLDEHALRILHFEFSHSRERKRSMYLIRLAKDVDEAVVDAFRRHEHITFVGKITI